MHRWYFSVATVLMLALTLLGFSDNLFTNVGQQSNADPKFVVHGLFCLTWMMLLAVQANLAGRRDIRLHRSLGIAGIFVAAGVVLSTLWVFIEVWKGWEAMQIVGRANRVFLPSYALCALLGFLNRRRPDRHKRLMFIASLYMLEPVLSRAFDPFDPLLLRFTDRQVDGAWWVFFVVVWNAFFLSLLAYDWKVLGRIHAITVGGYAWFCIVWTVIWFV
ncbi:MAG: hypothetical protein DI569_11560 [Sphingopyxis macrogoltabida]|uniref:Uncharacterized protein n=1 Tax=Sphingopyxis macrogoltabida TaxID=33050 RepID=A0A2W5KX92_SPHMC|nr:MAG: hypothetical protein DI569_11560 [Sphingopyxis macrogoltabida]